jgi:anti-sigma factor RsiW
MMSSNATLKENHFPDPARVFDCRKAVMRGGHVSEQLFFRSLSEEERNSQVEHAKTCSTCAERIRESQMIEELASHLPEYHMRSVELEHMRLLAMERKRQPKEMSETNRFANYWLVTRLPVSVACFVLDQVKEARAWLIRVFLAGGK